MDTFKIVEGLYISTFTLASCSLLILLLDDNTQLFLVAGGTSIGCMAGCGIAIGLDTIFDW